MCALHRRSFQMPPNNRKWQSNGTKRTIKTCRPRRDVGQVNGNGWLVPGKLYFTNEFSVYNFQEYEPFSKLIYFMLYSYDWNWQHSKNQSINQSINVKTTPQKVTLKIFKFSINFLKNICLQWQNLRAITHKEPCSLWLRSQEYQGDASEVVKQVWE